MKQFNKFLAPVIALCLSSVVCLYLFSVPVLSAYSGNPAFEARVDSLKQVYMAMGFPEDVAENRAGSVLEAQDRALIMPTAGNRVLKCPAAHTGGSALLLRPE